MSAATVRVRVVRCGNEPSSSLTVSRRQNLSGQWALIADKELVGWFDDAVVGDSHQLEADDRIVRNVIASGDATIVATGPSKPAKCVLWLVERALESLCFSSVFNGCEWRCSCYETMGQDGGRRDLLNDGATAAEELSRETTVAKNMGGSRRVFATLSAAWRRRRKPGVEASAVVVEIKLGRRRRQISFVDAPTSRIAKKYSAATVLVYVSPDEIRSIDESLRSEAARVELSEIEKENLELRETCKELETTRIAQVDLMDALFLVQSDALSASRAAAAALVAERDRLSLARQHLDMELADLYERYQIVENRAVQARKLDRSRQSLAAHGFDLDEDSSGDEHFVADGPHDDENTSVVSSHRGKSAEDDSSRRRRRTLADLNTLEDYEAACDSPPPNENTAARDRQTADVPCTAFVWRRSASSLRESLESSLLKLTRKY